MTLVQAHEEFEAAAVKNKELCDSLQSLEDKCRVADQKLSTLVVGLQPNSASATWLLMQQVEQHLFHTVVCLACTCS